MGDNRYRGCDNIVALRRIVPENVCCYVLWCCLATDLEES